MLRIEVGPNDLAASRFAIAPLSELEFLLRKIDGPAGRAAHPGAGATMKWRGRYQPLKGTLDARLLRALRPRAWGVDLTAPPPTGLAETVDDALAVVRGTPPAVARRQIRRSLDLVGPVDGEVRAILTGRRAVTCVADALERMWHALIAPDWPVLLAIAERDVLHRGRMLTDDGWASAIGGLHPSVRWDDGTVAVSRRPDETARLEGRGLRLVPSVFLHPGLAILLESPWQPTVFYPARGSGALWDSAPATPDGLGRLVGNARAAILLRLDDAASTTQLVRLTGQTLGAVGDHLRVLLDAGLVTRARRGRSVIYRRTPIGDAVVAGSADRP